MQYVVSSFLNLCKVIQIMFNLESIMVDLVLERFTNFDKPLKKKY